MKKQLPPDAIKPHDSVLQPRSLIFNKDVDAIVNMNNYAQWWTWQGKFPIKNESRDGFEFIAPVKSYPANSIGLFDITSNVWELTSDLFNVNYTSN